MGKIVLALSGSLRKESFSTKLVRAFGEQAPSGIEFRVADISKLPIYNQDDELPEPDFLLELKAQVKPADGILLVTPEYNRSIPPVLKNALDWVSRPQVPPGTGAWAGKAAALAGVSPYSLGAVSAVFHLRQVLTFLNMPAMQQPEFYLTHAADKFDDQGKLTDRVTKDHIDRFWAAFVTFMERPLPATAVTPTEQHLNQEGNDEGTD
jgi:chromate reductase